MTEKENLLYCESHEWLRADGDGFFVGLTDYAVKELGDIVFIDLPEADLEIEAGESVCEVESVKAVSEVYAPIGGVITAVNDEIADTPEEISNSPYESWLFKITGEAKDGLMSYQEYTAFCEGL